jgi:hypothetical protein
MKILLTTLSLIAFTSTVAFSAETVGEKIDAKANNAKRTVKTVVNRVDEKICDATDKSCLAKKTNHRIEEVKDYAEDKTTEAVNVIDNKETKAQEKKRIKAEKKAAKKHEKEIKENL